MTLILTHVGGPTIIQVADRLVTRTGREFDPLANKSVVFRARDALVAISYTGLAYLDRTPTDEWMAQHIIGETLMRGRRGDAPAMSRFGRLPQWLDIGQTAELLRSNLESTFAGLGSLATYPHTILIAGWHYGRRYTRPVAVRVTNRTNAPRFDVEWLLPRWWGLEGKSVLLADPVGNLPSQQFGEELLNRTHACRGSAVEVEMALVEAIRAVAVGTTVVGANCMRISLPRDPIEAIRVAFDPAVPHETALVLSRRSHTMAAFYSPWLIGPSFVAAPSVLTGGTMTAPLGNHVVEMGAGHRAEPHALPISMSAQVRRPLV